MSDRRAYILDPEVLSEHFAGGDRIVMAARIRAEQLEILREGRARVFATNHGQPLPDDHPALVGLRNGEYDEGLLRDVEALTLDERLELRKEAIRRIRERRDRFEDSDAAYTARAQR